MNKEQFHTILQSALFSFEGSTEEEILELNPEYLVKAVQTGIKLAEYLKSLEDFE